MWHCSNEFVGEEEEEETEEEAGDAKPSNLPFKWPIIKTLQFRVPSNANNMNTRSEENKRQIASVGDKKPFQLN